MSDADDIVRNLPANDAPTIPSADDIVRKLREEEGAEYLTKLAIDRSQDTTPAQYLEQRSLEKRSQLPADVVDRKRDELRRHYKVQDDYSALEGAFTTRQKIDGNPAVAKVLADEFGDVAGLERTVRRAADAAKLTAKATAQSFDKSWDNIEVNDITYQELTGQITPEQAERRAHLEQRMGEQPDLSEDIPWVGKFPYYAAEFLPQLFESGARSTAHAGLGLAAGAAAGSFIPGVGNVVGGIAGAAAGMRTGMMTFNYRQETANAFREYSQITDEEGNPIDREAAVMAAQLYGAVSAGLEMFGVEQIITRIPGAGTLLKGGLTNEVMTSALKVPSVRRALLRGAKLWAEGAMVEGTTEALQALAQAGIQGGLTQQQLGDADFGDDVTGDMAQGFEAGFYGGGGLTLPVAAGKTAFEVAEARKRNQLGQHWLDLGNAETQLGERDPELHDEIVNEANNGEAKIFIDPENLQTFLQESGSTLAELQDAAPKTAADYIAALEEDRAAEIDIAEFQRTLSKTDNYRTHLIQHLRRDTPDAQTLAEYATVQEDQATLMEEYQSIMEQFDNAAESDNQVVSVVRDQLIQAGQAPDTAGHMAAVHGAFYATQGAKIGVDPFELFKRMNVRVGHEGAAKEASSSIDRTDALLNRLRAGDTPTQREMYGKSLIQFLIDKGGVMDEGGEFSARDLDNPLIDYGGRKLSRPEGMSLETAYEQARDEGYVPADIASNELLGYIDREQQGNPVYSQSGEDSANINLAMELEDLERLLVSQGVNLSNANNKEARAKLAAETLYQQGSEGGATGDSLIPFIKLQQQVYGQDYQGKIEFPEGREFFRITLTESADLSTFLHESGHLFLETLNLINLQSPNDATTADLQAILDWMGVDSFDAIETVHHERFARAFEEYLMEGKAPSLELRDSFQRFSLWLKNIYSSVKKLISAAGGPGLSTEVRGVFDRMLASESQIQLAEQSEGLLPLFTDEGDMGVSEEGYEKYKAQYSRGHEASVNDLERKALRELNRRRKQEYTAAKAEVEAGVTEAVDNAPAQQAKHFFRTGEFRDGRKVPEAIAGKKMLTSGVLDIIPDSDVLKRLSFLYNGKGLHPDELAPFFGYSSGAQMLESIQMSKPRDTLIKEQTEAQMAKQHPDMMDGAGLAEEAIKSLHNESVSAFLLTELKALNKKVGDQSPLTPLAIIKQAARDAVASTKLMDLRPGKYRQAEQKNARLAIEAAAKKDFALAREHKRRQLQNHWMYREAIKTQDSFDKIRNRLTEFTTPKGRARIGKSSVAFLDQIDAYLEGIDFRRITAKAVRKRQGLSDWIKEQEDAGMIISIPDKLRDEANLKSYKDMTLPELQGIEDAVLHLAHMSRYKERLLAADEHRSVNAAAAGIIANLKEARPTKKEVNADPHKSALRKVGEFLSSMHGDLTKIEFIARWMDNGDAAGIAHKLIFRPMRDAQAAKLDMQKEYTQKIVAMFARMGPAEKARLGRKVEFQGKTFLVKDLYSIALNMGNAGNKFKLLKGYDWTESQVMELLEKNLTADDFGRVQEIWDLIETLWPAMSEIHRRHTGLAPPKVERESFAVEVGGETLTMEGGYYPVVYDRALNWRSEQNAQKTGLNDLFESTFGKPGVRAGATNARVESYYAPVKISMDVLPNHINEVIHFITHYDAVTNVDKLLNHKNLQTEMIDRLGQDMYKQFRPWLEAIAGDGRVQEEVTYVEKLATHVRVGTTVMSMGLSLTTPLMQILGVSNIVAELGPRYTMQGIGALARGGVWKNIANISKMSGEYRHVRQTFDRDVKFTLDKAFHVDAGIKGKAIQAWNKVRSEWAFALIGLVQSYVSAIAWQSGYQKAAAEGRDHADSIIYADAIMSQTQSGGAVKDLAAVQRGGPLRKLFTAFYTYFSLLYGNLSDMGINVGKGEYLRGAQQFVFLVWMPVIIEKLVRDGAPDEEDEETWGGWFGEAMSIDSVLYASTTIPGVRDVVSGALSDYGYSMAPAAQVLDRGSSAVSQFADDPGSILESEWMRETLVDMITVGTKFPFSKPYDYLENSFGIYMSDEAEEPVHDLLYGPRRD